MHTMTSVRRSMAREALAARRAGLPHPFERIDAIRRRFTPMATLSTERAKFASTQINLSGAAAALVFQAQQTIDPKDLAPKGMEESPHVTVKYGLHDDDPEPVRRIVAAFTPVTFCLGEPKVFPASEGKDFDVLVYEISPADSHADTADDSSLFKLNRSLSELEHTDTYPEYKPHTTIAYLKAGRGEKYVNLVPRWSAPFPFKAESLVFSSSKKHRTIISFADSWLTGGGRLTSALATEPAAVAHMDDTQHALFAAYLDALIRAKESTDPATYEAAAREADRLWAMLKGQHEQEGAVATMATDPFAAPKWHPYHGPLGGRGWINPETSQIRRNSRDPNKDYSRGSKPDDPYKDWMVPGEQLTDELRGEIDNYRARLGHIPPADAKVETYDPQVHGPSPQGHQGYADVGGKKLPVARQLTEPKPANPAAPGQKAAGPPKQPTSDPFADYEQGSQPLPGKEPKPQQQAAPKPAAPPGELRHNPDLDDAFGMMPPAPAAKPAPAPQPKPVIPGQPVTARVSVPSGGAQPQLVTNQAPAAAPAPTPAPQPSRTPARVHPPEPPNQPQPSVTPQQHNAAGAENYHARRQAEDRARIEWTRQHRPDLLHKIPGYQPPAPELYRSRTPAKIHGLPEEPVQLEPAEAPATQVHPGQSLEVSKSLNAPQPSAPTPSDPHAELAQLGADLERSSQGHIVPGLTERLNSLAARHDLNERELLQKAAEAHATGAGATPQAQAVPPAVAQGPPNPHPADIIRPAREPGMDEEEPEAQAQPNRRYGHAHNLLRKQAQAAGFNPDEIQSVADSTLEEHNRQAKEWNELLKYARQFSLANGHGSLTRHGKNKFVGGREDNQRGIDETAESTAARFPGHFRPEEARYGGSHEDQLREMLQQGNRPLMTAEQAYQKAIEQAQEEKHYRDVHERALREHPPAAVAGAIRAGEEAAEALTPEEVLGGSDEGHRPDGAEPEDFPFGANAHLATDAELFAVLSALPASVTNFTHRGEQWERIGEVEWDAFLNNDGWEPYRGPRNGIGWRNVQTGRVVYTTSPTAPGYARRQVQTKAARAIELSGRHAAHLRGVNEHALTDAELHELADHVQALPVHTLRSLKNHIMGTWGNVRRRQQMVEALTSHVRGLVDKHQAMEAEYHKGQAAKAAPVTDEMMPHQKREYWGGVDQSEGNTPSMAKDRLASWQQDMAAGSRGPAPMKVPTPAPAAPPPPPVPTPETAPTGTTQPWEPAVPPQAEAENPSEQRSKSPFPVDEKPPYNPRHTYYKVGPMQDVPLEHLIATQPDVNADYMGELMGGAQRKDENPPKVVKVGDKYYLENGHHAAALAHAKGEKALKAQVFEYDPATGQTKPASGATKDFPKAKPVPGEEKVPPAPAEHPTGKMDYEPIPEDVSDEEYDRLFEEKNKAVQAGLAKMAEKQKERAAKKAAPQESAPVAQETPPPPPAQAPTAEPAKTQPPEAPKADHLALARQYERGGVIDQEDAEKLRTTYAGLSDMDRTRFAEAFGVENAARSLPEVRDELVERKVKEMAHRGEHGPEVKRNTKNPLFGERGVGESKGLFDAEPEETPTGESNATEEIKHERGAGVEHSGNDRQRPQAEGSGSGSLPRAGGGAGERGQDGAQAKEEGRVEGQGRGLPQVDPEDLGRRLRAAHSDRMSDNPTTGRKGDEEYHRLQEQIDKLPPDQKAKAMAASEPEKPAPEPTGLRVRKANEYRHSNGTVTKTHYLSDDRHTVTEHGGKFVLHENAGGNLSHKGEYASIQEAVGAAGKPPPTSLPMPSVAHKTTEPPKSDLADRLKAHIANLKGEPEEHTSGVPLLKELDGLSQAEVYALLLSAGIEGARPTDSKANLILRLHRRMTAQARSQERNSV